MRNPLIIISITVTLLLISAGIGYAMLSDSSTTGLPPQNTSPADTTPPPTTTTTPPPATTTTPPPATTTTPPPTTTTTPPPTTTTTPPPVTTTTPPPATTATPPDEPPAGSFEQEIEKLKETITNVATTGESSEVSLVFSEAVVNDKAVQSLVGSTINAGVPMKITAVSLDLQAGNIIVAELKGTAYGLGLTIRVTAQVSIQAGKPVVEIIDANISKDLIAGALTQALDNLLTQLTRTGTADDGKVDTEFTSITIQQDELTLVVMVKPKV